MTKHSVINVLFNDEHCYMAVGIDDTLSGAARFVRFDLNKETVLMGPGNARTLGMLLQKHAETAEAEGKKQDAEAAAERYVVQRISGARRYDTTPSQSDAPASTEKDAATAAQKNAANQENTARHRAGNHTRRPHRDRTVDERG
jgi:hypothetical protein